MASVKISAQGQVTIPSHIRDRLGVGAGDRVDFLCNEATGTCEVVAAIQSIRELKGFVKKPVAPITIAEMDAIIGQCGAEASGRHLLQ